MVVAYFDCFSGIAGDMILGALFDLGLDLNFLKKEIGKLNISGYKIELKKVERNHITASDFYVEVTSKQPHRNLKEIKDLIVTSKLDSSIKKISIEIFLKLAKAEGKIHNVSFQNVHFHEIGAVDSIIDIVGSVIGIKKLGFEEIYSSPLPLGKGFVKCSHGIIPIPAPATVELLKNVPVYQTDIDHEMVTPTGAAVITTIASKFGDMPPMKIKNIGYGAGKIKSEQPGLLRIFLGYLEKKKKLKYS